METGKKRGQITYRQLSFLLLTALLLLAAVMLYLGRYAVPCADDYSYGTQVHRSWVETGSLWAALAASGTTIANIYTSWQGTFSACFLMAVQPAVFSESLYGLTTLLMLGSLLGGLFCLCLTLLPELFGVDRHVAALCASCLGILCTQLVPSPVQGFYWYNGAVYYTFYFGVFLMSISLALVWVKRGGWGRGVLLCVLAVFLGGGNYVTALSSVLLALGSILLLALLKVRSGRRLLVPGLFLLAAFILNVVAPGNAVRQATADNSAGVLGAVALSFRNGAVYGLRWLSLPLLGTLLFLLPVLWAEAKRSTFAFRFPLAVSLLSFCFFSAMFCPPLYATGGVGDKRLVNLLYYAYVVLWVLNLFYWMGWLAEKRKARDTRTGRLSPVKALLMLAVLGLGYLGGLLGGQGYTSLMAMGLLRSGEAEQYYAAAQQRLEILRDESIADAVLDPYPIRPYLLYFDDITTDPTDWRNTAAAEYYGKNTVVLKGE